MRNGLFVPKGPFCFGLTGNVERLLTRSGDEVEVERRIILGALLGSIAGAMVSQKVEARPVNMCEANKRVIQDLIERVWRNGRINELPTFWTADCINHADPAPQKRGLAALRLYHEDFAQWFRDFDKVKIEVQQQVAESDRVATQMILRAVHREKHRSVSLATIRIDRMIDGKIAEHWSVADMAGLTQQLA